MNNPPSPKTARPATPSPITVPPVNDTFRACFRLVRAACVVRTFALVATFIPMYPAVAEKTAPMINAIEIIQLEWICGRSPHGSCRNRPAKRP